MSKHTAADLKQMQSLPLDAKIAIWMPNKEGLGLAKVMEYVGIPWE